MPDARIPAQEPTLADAFAALPLEAPERSAWPLLAARIDAAQPPSRADRRFRRWLFAAATAAALGAVALLPREIVAPAGPDSASTLAATDAATDAAAGVDPPGIGDDALATGANDLESLMDESARLEFLLQQVGDELAGSASTTALALEFEARVQQLDVALSDPALTVAQRTALWDRRVDLLREYAAVQGTAQWLAAQGQDYDGDLVAVF